MRKAFVKTLIELAEKDERICLLTGDLGFHALEEFKDKFPGRFLNCGIAEQNMAGMAAGLALCGKKPYIYSIVPFVTLRCLEQIRNDICYQNLDVKIIGIGGGFSYGTLGSTHSVMEEMAILRTIPNMSVFSPADLLETEELFLKTYENKNPAYFRLSNIGQYEVYDKNPNLEIGKPNVVKDGADGVIVATGLMVSICLDIIKKIKNENNINLKLLSVHTVKPLDEKLLMEQISDFKKIFVIEEHSVIGGLGSIVAEVLADSGYGGILKRVGMDDEFLKEIGTADYLRAKHIVKKNGAIEDILNYFK